MDFKSLTKYLDDCLIFGIKPSLTRIKRILELLDEPQKKLDFIHIVGTNGKTSTVKMLSSILYEKGISCGYHISPHISSYTERIWINGSDITEIDFTESFERIQPAIEEVNRSDLGGPMTQFEILAAMAFEIACHDKLDMMILEAGMGGRWDATNAADSVLAGLTGVSLEHTDILGDTIEEIASEKVEVVKPGTLAVTTSNDQKVVEILKQKADSVSSRVFIYGEDFTIISKEDKGLSGWEIDIKGIMDTYNGISLPVLGDYQPLNLSLALVLSELYLEKSKQRLDSDDINGALSKINIMGRFEIIKKEPMVIADAAHNPEGIQKLCENLNRYFSDRRRIVIFSVLKDKDYRKMIRKVLGLGDMLVLTSSDDKRSLDIDNLERVTLEIMQQDDLQDRPGQQIFKIDNIDNSLNFALNMAKSSDIICITGSITNLEYVY